MNTYRVTFVDNKCGRGNQAEPFEVKARDVHEAAHLIFIRARRWLASRGADYDYDFKDSPTDTGPALHGFVYAGDRPVGEFSAEVVQPEPVPLPRPTLCSYRNRPCGGPCPEGGPCEPDCEPCHPERRTA